MATREELRENEALRNELRDELKNRLRSELKARLTCGPKNAPQDASREGMRERLRDVMKVEMREGLGAALNSRERAEMKLAGRGTERWKRIPRHIGVIPDGNRRWAVNHGMEKKDGYEYGIEPGFELYELCRKLGVEELTLYGFTVDNTKRPATQKTAFQKACVDAVTELAHRDAQLLVVGNEKSKAFPQELSPLRTRQTMGHGGIKVNFLVNYGWEWDLSYPGGPASRDISRIDLLIRWGGRRRLSGFLPVQSVYADIYVVDELWPDFTEEQFFQALDWYQKQDITLGG